MTAMGTAIAPVVPRMSWCVSVRPNTAMAATSRAAATTVTPERMPKWSILYEAMSASFPTRRASILVIRVPPFAAEPAENGACEPPIANP